MSFKSYLSESIVAHIKEQCETVGGVERIPVSSDSPARLADYENESVLQFVAQLHAATHQQLHQVLAARVRDRALIDEQMAAAARHNEALGVTQRSTHAVYRSALGESAAFGPHESGDGAFYEPRGEPVAALPAHLRGPHVTLFGPPDDLHMAANALNAMHRRMEGEPALVGELVARAPFDAKWGADDEDSKTPLRDAMLAGQANLRACFRGEIEGETLCETRRTAPIKRVPGLALPSTAHLIGGEPVPLHLLDIAMHVFWMWEKPEALTFYFPKLENEHEAAYLAAVFAHAERLIKQLHDAYRLGTIRVLCVLENPRALFRINEIMDALHPYFVGGSLGWHDYLASTARLFQADRHYRIPVKSDPDIVVRHIKESHLLVADVVRARGGIGIGGMYGVLPTDKAIDSASMRETLFGYVRDVVTQLKRGLDGFWVAHPSFVRIGVAMVQAWHEDAAAAAAAADGDALPTFCALVRQLVDAERAAKLIEFVRAPDATGSLDRSSSAYPRAVLAAELGVEAGALNSTAKEVRYNVTQMMHYLTAWLGGSGCVALPAEVRGVAVRVMDDLATTERSRWEVYLELKHGRFDLFELLGIIDEVVRDMRESDERLARNKWFGVARRLLTRFMTDRVPLEFCTELLMTFTIDSVRGAADPWRAAEALDAHKFRYAPSIALFERALAAEPRNVERARALASASPLALDATLRELVDGASGVAGATVATLWPLSGYGDERDPSLLATRRADVCVNAAASGAQLTPDTLVQVASLSKTIGTAFAFHVFAERGLSLETPVNEVLAATASTFRVRSGDSAHPEWAEQVQLQHLVSHTALGQHYVYGVSEGALPDTLALLNGDVERYEPVMARKRPDSAFAYSGAGFVLLQHVLEALDGSGQHISALMAPWLEQLGLADEIVVPGRGGVVDAALKRAAGFRADGSRYELLAFPPLAAGMWATPRALARFLRLLVQARTSLGGAAGGALSHETALRMTHARPQSVGARQFMHADCALGLFIAECGPNRVALHQAANEGFRGLYAVCVSGPDAGKGFVSIALGDDAAVSCNAAIGRAVLGRMTLQGWRGDRLPPLGSFDNSGLSPETVVNQGLKQLLFAAFERDLPETVDVPTGTPVHAHAAHDALRDASVLRCSNQRFARASNLVLPHVPLFDADAFGRHGKIMDSWESVRHNPLPYDSCVLQLSGAVRERKLDLIEVSTAWHDGNHAKRVAVDGSVDGETWIALVADSPLAGHTVHRFVALDAAPRRWRFVRLRIAPDGGLSRLRMFSSDDVPRAAFPSQERDARQFPRATNPKAIALLDEYPSAAQVAEHWRVALQERARAAIDVACDLFGGVVEEASNEHYGKAAHVVSWRAPRGMFDGFESARAHRAGHCEWVIVRLGRATRVQRVLVDMRFFVNNNPERLRVEGFCADKREWFDLLPSTFTKPFAAQQAEFATRNADRVASKVRVSIIPCGGFNRIKVFGLSA